MDKTIIDFQDTLITNCRNVNEKIHLKDLWKDKPVILLFLRRLGCSLCRAYVVEIQKYKQNLENKNCKVVCLTFEAFGQESDSDFSFQKGNYWNGDIYSIDKNVYTQLYEKKGFGSLLGLLTIDKKVTKMVKDNNVKGNFKGDGFQMGGQMIINTDGKVLLDHRQKAYGDDAEIDTLFDVLDSIKSS